MSRGPLSLSLIALVIGCASHVEVSGTDSGASDDQDASSAPGGASAHSTSSGGALGAGGAASGGRDGSAGGRSSAGGGGVVGGAGGSSGAWSSGGATALPEAGFVSCPTDRGTEKDLVPASYQIPGKMTLKLVEGSHVRLRDGTLAIDPSKMLPEDPGLLRCWHLTVSDAISNLTDLNALFAERAVVVTTVFDRPPEDLDRERAEITASSGMFVADLNLYFHLDFDPSTSESIAQAIAKNPLVETSYFDSIPAPPP